jgi:glycosyltransferase involved in cell wall biosynthesis
MNSINFSIIIPHKNTPVLLQRCLDSIPRREDIQIIVVDDNSDADKVDFTKFPCLDDPCVELVLGKNENGRKGAGYARNLGLERAKGKWLLFADADDFFTDNAFDALFEEVDSEHEIVYFKAIGYSSNALEKVYRNKLVNTFVDQFIKGTKDSKDRIRYQSLVPWGKMINRQLVLREDVQFEEVIAGNDVRFSLLTGHLAKSIIAIAKVIYCVTRNRGSITNTLSYESLLARYLEILKYNNFLSSVNKRRYRQSIMPFMYRSLKYFGFISFLKFIRLAIIHKNNLFIGMRNSLYSLFFLYKERKNKTKYLVKK